jgi:hypothetical protein
MMPQSAGEIRAFRQVRWQFTADDARVKLRHPSPKG